jgi:hypothetical protein
MAQEYEIRIQGVMSGRWTSWFEGLTLEIEETSDGSQLTKLSGRLIDQAELRGILIKLWNLNMTVLSVTRLETDIEKHRGELNGTSTVL